MGNFVTNALLESSAAFDRVFDKKAEGGLEKKAVDKQTIWNLIFVQPFKRIYLRENIRPLYNCFPMVDGLKDSGSGDRCSYPLWEYVMLDGAGEKRQKLWFWQERGWAPWKLFNPMKLVHYTLEVVINMVAMLPVLAFQGLGGLFFGKQLPPAMVQPRGQEVAAEEKGQGGDQASVPLVQTGGTASDVTQIKTVPKRNWGLLAFKCAFHLVFNLFWLPLSIVQGLVRVFLSPSNTVIRPLVGISPRERFSYVAKAALITTAAALCLFLPMASAVVLPVLPVVFSGLAVKIAAVITTAWLSLPILYGFESLFNGAEMAYKLGGDFSPEKLQEVGKGIDSETTHEAVCASRGIAFVDSSEFQPDFIHGIHTGLSKMPEDPPKGQTWSEWGASLFGGYSVPSTSASI